MQSPRRLSIPLSAVSLFALACLIAAAGWIFFDDQAAAQAPANQPPEFIHAVKRGVNENSPAGTNVGVPVTAADPDGDAITYSLSGAGSELFTIDDGGQIKVGAGTNLDHETTPSYAVTVHADDGNGGTASVNITINVKDVDETEYPPEFIHAVQRGVDENSPAGTNVGAPVTANDPNGDTITYSLSGAGSDLFTIDGSGQIKVGAGTNLDHETTPSYAVTVHADDGNGGTDSVNITINVRDVEEEETAPVAELPAVSVVSATGGPESGSLTFGLERTGDASEALTVNVSVSETGTMLAANPPTASFPAGSATTTLSVLLDDDAVDEPDSTVTLTVQAGEGYTVSGASAAAIATDDDLPTVTIEAGSASVSEAAGPATFTLTRNGVLSAGLTVSVGISETESMLADTQPATAIFNANSATATLEAALDDDDADEADSVVTVTVADGDDYEVGNPSSATITVTDDDLPTVALSTVISGLVGNTGQPAATGIGSASDVAQAFTTGSNAGGYALEGVEIGLTVGSNSARPGILRLMADQNGAPGQIIQTFNDPATRPAGYALRSYAPRTAAYFLSPDTTYWLMWDNFQAHNHTLSATTSDGEDAGLAGWSIGDVLHTRGQGGGAWTADADSRAALFRLEGQAATAPAGGKLVGNRGQSPMVTLPWTGSRDYATSFTTGSGTAGYRLTGLILDMATDIAHGSSNGTDLAVSIHADNGGEPTGSLLAALLPPAQVGVMGAEYRVPGDGLYLYPNNRYWVYLDTLAVNSHRLKATTSDAEDADGAAGWSIGYAIPNRGHNAGGNSVIHRNHALAMELKGYAIPSDEPLTITIAADQASVSEAAGQATFTLTRTGGDRSEGLTVNVGVTETGGSMLAASQPAAAIFASNSVTATLAVPLHNDIVSEPDSVVMATVQPGDDYEAGSPSAASVTVIDDDAAVLVGNTGQPAATAIGSDSDVAQAFTTGSNAGGYALESVEAYLSIGSSAAAPGIMRLLSDDNGSPGDLIQTFKTTASFATGLHAYATRAAAVILSPDTTYWLSWDNSQEHDHTLNTTASDSEGVAAAGWSIGDVLHTKGRDSGAWAADADSRAVKFRLKGRASAAPAGVTLVGNLGQPLAEKRPLFESTSGRDWREHHAATSFRTGSAPGGYTLTGVNLDIAVYDHSNRNPDLAIQIFTYNDEVWLIPNQATWSQAVDPNGELLSTLLPPAHLAAGVNEFRVPGSGLALDPDTTYWVVFDREEHSIHYPKVTPYTDEDAGGAPGWSIGDKVLFQYYRAVPSWNSWGAYDNSMLMELVGYSGQPVVTIAAEPASVSEGDGQATFTLTRHGSLISESLTVNVNIAETGGSMLASGQPTTVPFAANSATATLTVSLVDDAPIMSNSVVTATVQSGDGYAVGSASTASVTVTDDDTVRVTIEANQASVSEADGQATFTLTRTGGDHSGGLTVNVAISETGGSMLPASAPTTAIFAANSATTTLTVSLVDDSPIALDSIVTATVQSGDGYLVGSPSAASVTVIDDEPSTVTIRADQTNVSEADGQATFTLSRAGNLSRELTVNVAVSEDQAMLADNQPATAFFAANSATTTLTVELHDDEVSEPSSTVTVTVQSVVGYTVGSPASATVTVTDDEGPTVTIEADQTSVSEADGQATFTLTRTGDVSQGLTVNVAVSESGGNMLASRQPTVATFMANSATATLIARLVNDSVGEMDSEVTATVEAGGGYAVGSPSEATITVTDDEGPTVTIIANNPNINEAAAGVYAKFRKSIKTG